MKTQEIFNVAVTLNKNVENATTGLIEKVVKEVLFKDSALPAYDSANAKIKATAAALAKRPSVDLDEVEVLVRPFCG